MRQAGIRVWNVLRLLPLVFAEATSDLCLGGIPWCIWWYWWQSRCWCLPGQRATWRNRLPGSKQRERMVSPEATEASGCWSAQFILAVRLSDGSDGDRRTEPSLLIIWLRNSKFMHTNSWHHALYAWLDWGLLPFWPRGLSKRAHWTETLQLKVLFLPFFFCWPAPGYFLWCGLQAFWVTRSALEWNKKRSSWLLLDFSLILIQSTVWEDDRLITSLVKGNWVTGFQSASNCTTSRWHGSLKVSQRLVSWPSLVLILLQTVITFFPLSHSADYRTIIWSTVNSSQYNSSVHFVFL